MKDLSMINSCFHHFLFLCLQKSGFKTMDSLHDFPWHLGKLSFSLLDCHYWIRCDRSFSAFTRNLPKSSQPDGVASKDIGYVFQQSWMYLHGTQFYRVDFSLEITDPSLKSFLWSKMPEQRGHWFLHVSDMYILMVWLETFPFCCLISHSLYQ